MAVFSRASSAYIFFNRLFSLSNSRTRLSSLTDTPEYLLFHWYYSPLLIPCFLQISATGSPASPSANTPTI